MANRWWKDDEAGSQGRFRRWWLLIPGGLVMVLLLGSMIYTTGRIEGLATRSTAEVEAAVTRAQAREAEQRDLRRQELQTLLTIADELRRVREVLEAR